jgi:phosphatidate cytidylyltransferase
MKRVLTALVLILVVLLIVFKAPLWLFAAILAAIVLLAQHEYLNIVAACDIQPVRWLTYLASVLIIVGLLFLSQDLIYMGFPWRVGLLFSPALLLLLPVIFGVPIVFRNDMKASLQAAAASSFGVLYIAVSLGLLTSLRHSPGNEYLILFILFSVWGGDIAAYYVGRSLGRHKLAPVVSPNKSWEGALASVFASVAIAALVFHYRASINSLFLSHHDEPISFTVDLTWTSVLILGVVTNIAAQLGDLFESALKRGAGVKDSGTLLPGHGGMLDRIDALLFAIPVVWYYATFTGLFRWQDFYRLVTP